jgi:hypothetical protein
LHEYVVEEEPQEGSACKVVMTAHESDTAHVADIDVGVPG